MPRFADTDEEFSDICQLLRRYRRAGGDFTVGCFRAQSGVI